MDIILVVMLTLISNFSRGQIPIYVVLLVISGNLVFRSTLKKYDIIYYIVLVVLALINPSIFYLLPIGLMGCTNKYIGGVALVYTGIKGDYFTLFLTVLSLYLTYKNNFEEREMKKIILSRDLVKKDALLLEEQNKEIKLYTIKAQEIAVLKERDRISRELHDSIGHTISSAILQTKALSIMTRDEDMKRGLETLKNSLEINMIEIRNTLHNLHSTSFDLQSRVEDLFEPLKDTKTSFNYNIENELPQDLKYDIIRIIREAISNYIKHSNGSEFNINLYENLKFYILEIKDNGTDIKDGKGLGLHSIREIAAKYQGLVNISIDRGFKLHIALRRDYENNSNR